MLRLSTIALLLAALLISACGSDEEGSTESTSAATTPTTEDDGVAIGPDADATAGPTESDEGGEPLTRAEVRKLVERFATSDDPADCELATESLLRRSFGGHAGCRAIARSGVSAERIAFERVEVNGGEAEVVIVPKDGLTAGLEIRVRVVRADGEAKIDQFRAPGVGPGP